MERKEKSLTLTLPTEISTQIIDQRAHPRDLASRNPADWAENYGVCCRKWRDFACAPYNSLEGYLCRHGAQCCACFLDSWGCKLAWHVQDHSMGRQYFHRVHQVGFPSSERYPEPKWTRAVRLTSRVTPSSLKVQTLWIWGSRPSTHRMDLGTPSSPIPE